MWSFKKVTEEARRIGQRAVQAAVDCLEVITDGFAAALEEAGSLVLELQHDGKILCRLTPDNAELLLNPRGLTAAHEAGHAVLCWRSPTVQKIDSAQLHKNGGTVWRQNTKIPTNVSRWYDIAISLAGIAAELEFGPTFSPSACRSDLLKSVELARAMVAENYSLASCPWNNDEAVETIDVGSVLKPRPPDEVNAILNRCFQHARFILRTNEVGLLQLAKEILRREKLTHNDVIGVLGPRPFNEKMLF